MGPSPKQSISQGHHGAQGEGGRQLNMTVSDRDGANAAGRAVGTVVVGTLRASWILPMPGMAPPRGAAR